MMLQNRKEKLRNFLLIIAILIILILFKTRFDKIRAFSTYIFMPIKSSIYNLTSSVKEKINDIIYIKELIKENNSLRKKIYTTELKELDYKKILEENSRLRKMLKLKERYKYKSLVADVIYRDSLNAYQNLFINKGENDGVKKDMAVISNGFLVGKITKVLKKSSQVDLISKNNFKVGAEINKNIGIVVGGNSLNLELKNIIIDSKVEIGDVVKTAGISDIYPEGITIGEVSKISKSKDNMFRMLYVKIPKKIMKIHEVMVIGKERKK
ncbi:rod shape-determining protein MreC [Haliovirga abyssi]|uniref:Cell shape-determining protein MreC n=1 Tax=Haliovirga abyssi TaxID=2996794 RepID=A0AAU9DGC7_9FUSO|nr:rod shape-determining protein MreC [Haliovirga abyssi]BDU50497.1 cell shape-determining protein MreC [Haliovirga abyssi]